MERTKPDPGPPGGHEAPDPLRPIARAYGRGCRRSLLAMLLGGPLGIALVAYALWLAQAPLGPPSRARGALLAVAAFLPVALFLGAVALAAVWVSRRRARPLDDALAPLGARGRQHGPVMRSWHGTLGTRRADAWFGKGPQLELYLDVDAATRLAVGVPGRSGTALARRFGREPLAGDGLPLPPGAAVYAEDEPWARRLLAVPGVAGALTALLAQDGRTLTSLGIEPASIHYLRRFDPLAELRRERVESWLEHLETVARAVERLGPSLAGETPSRLERWARHHRGRTLRKALAWVLVVGGGVFVAIVALVAWLGIGPT